LLTEPQAAFAYQTTAGSNLVELVNQSQYVYPDSIDGGHYIWDFGDGSPPFRCGQGYGACPDVVTHEYAAAQGQYTATLTAVVCSDTSAASQTMAVLWNEVGDAHLPPQLYVTPNPATDLLHVAPSAPVSGNFCLYDVWGREVRRVALSAAPQTLSVSDLPTGLYFWTFYDYSNPNRALGHEKIAIVR